MCAAEVQQLGREPETASQHHKGQWAASDAAHMLEAVSSNPVRLHVHSPPELHVQLGPMQGRKVLSDLSSFSGTSTKKHQVFDAL